MKPLFFFILGAVLAISGSIQAQEHFYDNGVCVGLDAGATHLTRDKKINYASSGPSLDSLSFFEAKVKDWSASPTLTIGYKFDDSNSLSLRGGWAHYSLGRSFTVTSRFFAVTAVEGGTALIVDGLFGPPGVDVSIDWKSNVADFDLEYQRKMWSDNLGAVLGVLGLRYRYERQEFDGVSSSLSNFPPPSVFTWDTTHEQLREHLYGPYAGLKVSFKPAADSKLGITLGTRVGWLFKNAELRARNTQPSFFPPLRSFARNDHSSQGTPFIDVSLKLSYSISKNIFVNLGYELDWIGSDAHISSPVAIFGPGAIILATVPARIVESPVLTHSIGLGVSYRF